MLYRKEDQITNFFKGALFGFVIITCVAFLVACGRQDGQRRVGIGAGYFGAVGANGGCPAGTILWEAATGYTSNGSAQLALHLCSQPNATQNDSGQLIGVGQLIVNQPMACQGGFTGLQPGIYTISTFNVAGYNGNLFGGLNLQAASGFNQAQIYMDVGYVREANPRLSVCGNRTGVGNIYNSLTSSAFVTNVNGYPCNLNISTVVPNGVPLCN